LRPACSARRTVAEDILEGGGGIDTAQKVGFIVIIVASVETSSRAHHLAFGTAIAAIVGRSSFAVRGFLLLAEFHLGLSLICSLNTTRGSRISTILRGNLVLRSSAMRVMMMVLLVMVARPVLFLGGSTSRIRSFLVLRSSLMRVMVVVLLVVVRHMLFLGGSTSRIASVLGGNLVLRSSAMRVMLVVLLVVVRPVLFLGGSTMVAILAVVTREMALREFLMLRSSAMRVMVVLLVVVRPVLFLGGSTSRIRSFLVLRSSLMRVMVVVLLVVVRPVFFLGGGTSRIAAILGGSLVLRSNLVLRSSAMRVMVVVLLVVVRLVLLLGGSTMVAILAAVAGVMALRECFILRSSTLGVMVVVLLVVVRPVFLLGGSVINRGLLVCRGHTTAGRIRRARGFFVSRRYTTLRTRTVIGTIYTIVGWSCAGWRGCIAILGSCSKDKSGKDEKTHFNRM